MAKKPAEPKPLDSLPDVIIDAAEVVTLPGAVEFVSTVTEPRNLTREFLAGIFGEAEARKRIP